MQSLTGILSRNRWDNQLSVVETLNINKTDALAYLAGSGPEPARWARVSVMFGVGARMAITKCVEMKDSDRLQHVVSQGYGRAIPRGLHGRTAA